MSKDLEEVTRLINLYIEGAGKGNADKLNEAFHSSARWFGTMGGTDYDVDKAGFVALMVESPADGGQLKAEITDIQIDGTVAVVTLKEEGFWGTLSFTDYFTLSVLEGRWQITNKTFAHTGGEHAQGSLCHNTQRVGVNRPSPLRFNSLVEEEKQLTMFKSKVMSIFASVLVLTSLMTGCSNTQAKCDAIGSSTSWTISESDWYLANCRQ